MRTENTFSQSFFLSHFFFLLLWRWHIPLYFPVAPSSIRNAFMPFAWSVCFSADVQSTARYVAAEQSLTVKRTWYLNIFSFLFSTFIRSASFNLLSFFIFCSADTCLEIVSPITKYCNGMMIAVSSCHSHLHSVRFHSVVII